MRRQQQLQHEFDMMQEAEPAEAVSEFNTS